MRNSAVIFNILYPNSFKSSSFYSFTSIITINNTTEALNIFPMQTCLALSVAVLLMQKDVILALLSLQAF